MTVKVNQGHCTSMQSPRQTEQNGTERNYFDYLLQKVSHPCQSGHKLHPEYQVSQIQF